MKTVRLKVRRQDAPDVPETSRWEQFDVPRRAGLTIAGALAHVAREPVSSDGRRVAPIAYEAGCLEELCGACTMRINGSVRLACTARVDELSPKGQTIALEPLEKFPLVRDLVVERSRLFGDLKRARAWIAVDSMQDRGPGPRESSEAADRRRLLSPCIGCGACLEACPQYGDHSDFVGAAALLHVELSNSAPLGHLARDARLDTVMAPGGVSDCGKAQNCVEVCPAKIPLVDSIQRVARAATKRLLFGWLLD